jgi:riboflavin kinase/FMN adenylyltransferase
MKIHYNFNDFGSIKNPVVTTGTFDGVHIGHAIIISRLNELASQIQGESVLITFHPHPRKVLFPEQSANLKLINTQNEKILMLSKTKLDHLFIINFTKEFSQTTSQNFVNDLLLDKLQAKIIVVGFNHHFGHNREGDYEYLYELSKKRNFSVEEIPQQDIENEAVSSTRIRKAIFEGNIMRANASLNHQYFIMGKTHCTYDLHTQGTNYQIEVEEIEKLLPPCGRYAAKIEQNQNIYNCLVEILEFNNNTKVYILGVDKLIIDDNTIANLYFFKRLSLYDDSPETFILTRETDKNLVRELIY